MNKFKVGDAVKIINYGHKTWYSSQTTYNNFQKLEQVSKKKFEQFLLWGESTIEEPIYEEDDNLGAVIVDNSAFLVGKEGIISEVTNTQGLWKYSIKGIPEKAAWYNEDQLQLIN